MKQVLWNAGSIFDHPGADAILLQDGMIEAVGQRDDFLHEIRNGAECINAEHAVVLPGFIDAHIHFTLMGIDQFTVDLSGLLSRGELLDRIQEAHASKPSGEPIQFINYDYDQVSPEHRITADDLNLFLPGRIVQILDRCGHHSITNRYSLEQTGIPLDTSGAGKIEEDGLICCEANMRLCDYFSHILFVPEKIRCARKTAADYLMRHGVTGIHMMCGACEAEIPLEPSPLHIRRYIQTREVERAAAAGLRQIGGCGAVSVDGDTGPYTAALLEPYTAGPKNCGVLNYTDEELDAYVWEAHSRDMQIGLHCVGDGASAQLISAIEKAQARDGKQLRHRVEHFEVGNMALLERSVKAGICLSVQPSFIHFWPHMSYEDFLGKERSLLIDMVGSLLKAGAAVGFGSDGPVTPADPMLTIHSAVNHSNPVERITPAQAIRCHTYGSAYLGWDENRFGRIAPGYAGDFALLADDPCAVDPQLIKDIPVVRTIIGGETVFSSL